MGKKPKRIKRKIKVRKSAKLVHRNDATRVDRSGADTAVVRKAPFVIRDNGLNMKLKIKKK